MSPALGLPSMRGLARLSHPGKTTPQQRPVKRINAVTHSHISSAQCGPLFHKRDNPIMISSAISGQLSDPGTGKKRKYWYVDPSVFKPGLRSSRKRRYLLEPAKSLAKFGFFGLLLIYPLGMVISGLIFGAFFFWSSFVGSLALIGFVIWKAGYASNFAAWNPDFRRQILGLTVGFLLTAGLYIGLITLLQHLELATWVVAALGAIVIIGVGF